MIVVFPVKWDSGASIINFIYESAIISPSIALINGNYIGKTYYRTSTPWAYKVQAKAYEYAGIAADYAWQSVSQVSWGASGRRSEQKRGFQWFPLFSEKFPG